jgi:hypothetical protein
MKKIIFPILLLLFFGIFGCSDSDEKYESGYSDGYAEGYNTTLEIRATMIEGDFANEAYKNGYNDGRIDGVADAMKKN